MTLLVTTAKKAIATAMMKTAAVAEKVMVTRAEKILLVEREREAEVEAIAGAQVGRTPVVGIGTEANTEEVDSATVMTTMTNAFVIRLQEGKEKVNSGIAVTTMTMPSLHLFRHLHRSHHQRAIEDITLKTGIARKKGENTAAATTKRKERKKTNITSKVKGGTDVVGVDRHPTRFTSHHLHRTRQHPRHLRHPPELTSSQQPSSSFSNVIPQCPPLTKVAFPSFSSN